MKQENVTRAIMVITSNLTPFARQSLLDLMPRLNIEQFTENELLVNITKHVLVPEHRILSKEEKQVLLNRYKVKETQLPRIQVRVLHRPVDLWICVEYGTDGTFRMAASCGGTYHMCEPGPAPPHPVPQT
eukprot:365802-Chlamydomonas_euryale.AAC.6